jgi:hypothetical protein
MPPGESVAARRRRQRQAASSSAGLATSAHLPAAAGGSTQAPDLQQSSFRMLSAEQTPTSHTTSRREGDSHSLREVPSPAEILGLTVQSKSVVAQGSALSRAPAVPRGRQAFEADLQPRDGPSLAAEQGAWALAGPYQNPCHRSDNTAPSLRGLTSTVETLARTVENLAYTVQSLSAAAPFSTPIITKAAFHAHQTREAPSLDQQPLHLRTQNQATTLNIWTSPVRRPVPSCKSGANCRFLLQGTCRFSHGETPFTEARLECRHGAACKFLTAGTCLFRHDRVVEADEDCWGAPSYEPLLSPNIENTGAAVGSLLPGLGPTPAADNEPTDPLSGIYGTKTRERGEIGPRCPSGHPLQAFSADGEFECDICLLLFVEGELILGCHSCDYGVCPRCQQDWALGNGACQQAVTTQQQAGPSVLDRKPFADIEHAMEASARNFQAVSLANGDAATTVDVPILDPPALVNRTAQRTRVADCKGVHSLPELRPIQVLGVERVGDSAVVGQAGSLLEVPGTRVCVHGLLSSAGQALNMKLGVVTHTVSRDTGRVGVLIDGHSSPKAILPRNLHLVGLSFDHCPQPAGLPPPAQVPPKSSERHTSQKVSALTPPRLISLHLSVNQNLFEDNLVLATPMISLEIDADVPLGSTLQKFENCHGALLHFYWPSDGSSIDKNDTVRALLSRPGEDASHRAPLIVATPRASPTASAPVWTRAWIHPKASVNQDECAAECPDCEYMLESHTTSQDQECDICLGHIVEGDTILSCEVCGWEACMQCALGL